MRAKEFLQQIEKNNCLIKNKLAERLHWRELATNSTAKISGIKVKSSSDNTAMQNQVIEAVTIDSEIQKLKADTSYRISVLQKLDIRDYDFLHKVYVQNMTLKEVSYNANKSYSWATSTHYKALQKLQEILDSAEKKSGC